MEGANDYCTSTSCCYGALSYTEWISTMILFVHTTHTQTNTCTDTCTYVQIVQNIDLAYLKYIN